MILSLLLPSWLIAEGQGQKIHPIVTELKACRDKAMSTVDTIHCIDAAMKAWDQELNIVYTKLMNTIETDEAKTALKEAQSAWLHFKDQEAKFTRNYYGSMQGTIWGIIAVDVHMNLIKDRVRTLYNLLESTDLSGENSINYSFDEPKDAPLTP